MGIFIRGVADRAKKTAVENAAKKAAKAASLAVKPAKAAVEKTAPLAVERVGIKAYHGSPHAFDKFDLSKIGTGEGAQSYGHGLYFAENEGVARSYRDQLSGGTDRLVGGKPYNSKNPEHLAASLIKTYENHGGRDRILQVLRDDLASMDLDAASKDTYQKTIDIIKNNAPLQPFKTSPRGHMYEVNINADPKQFLDWDAPLSAQPDIYQKVLADRNWRRRLQFRTDEGVGEMKGSNLYGMGHDQTRNLGVPGIRYLDQGSRGAGSGTSNYVVFDPDLLEIKRRYAKGGATAKAHGGRVSPLTVKRKGKK